MLIILGQLVHSFSETRKCSKTKCGIHIGMVSDHLPLGCHVIQLEESRDRPPPAFELVEPQIRQSLTAAEERRISGELRATASVEKLVPDVAPPQEDDGHDH